MVQVDVGHVRYSGAYPSTVDSRLYLRWLLVEPLDGCHRTVQNSQRHAVVDYLEESESGGGASDIFNDNGAVMIGKVYGRDVFRSRMGSGAGFEVGKDLGCVNKEAGNGGDAGVDEAFDSDLGIVELLDLRCSVVFCINGRRRSHG